jgi:enamine deaminase RidA (YjgF/YER057c/UK114 family)
MIDVTQQRFRGLTTWELIGEGQAGSPAEQTQQLLTDIGHACETLGGSLSDLVFIRFWMRSRGISNDVRAVRRKLIDDKERTASSSFFSTSVFKGSGDVRIDALYCPDHRNSVRKPVEFDPPRRYLHYLARGNGLFTSGMAEAGVSVEEQCQKNLAWLDEALQAEGFQWSNVCQLNLFRERGQSIDWAPVLSALATRNDPEATIITLFDVDGLASPDKHLEIELIATRPDH